MRETRILNTPILFCVYKRPETTVKVFEIIRKVRPKKLFIAANAPKKDNVEELKKCNDVKEIVENVDWNCDVHKLYREEHLGLKNSITSAINWFFSEVEEGIILEDDVCPDVSFFSFCEELLNKYKHDTRIMQINGLNVINADNHPYSYYFSRFGPCWGWASWRRAWEMYDRSLKYWNEIRDLQNHKSFCDSVEEESWRITLFKYISEERNEAWDFQWVYFRLINSGLSVTPKYNLIKNMGFGGNSTHTNEVPNYMKNLDCKEISFPLKHPPYVLRSFNYDSLYFNSVVYNNLSFYDKTVLFFKKIINTIFKSD